MTILSWLFPVQASLATEDANPSSAPKNKDVPFPSSAPKNKDVPFPFSYDKKAVLDSYNKYCEIDRADLIKAQEELPNISTKNAKVGCIICLENIEVAAPFIEKISVKSLGKAPRIFGYSYIAFEFEIHVDNFQDFGGAAYSIPAFPTIIEIKTLSGTTYNVKINRHAADAVLAELLRLWRENR